MRAPAAALLLSLLAAFHAPLVAAAAGPRMDCCAGGMTQMCCPLADSCSMRSCAGDDGEATLSAMSVFLLPAAAAPVVPAFFPLTSPGRAFAPLSEAPPVLDPPPRV